MHDAERLALGLVAAERARRANVAGAEVLEIDGLVLVLANLPDPTLSGVVVAHRPQDPAAALRAAEAAFEDRGMSFGVELQAGRHPQVDLAVEALGLARIIERPGMVADPRSLGPTEPPPGVTIRPVETDADVEGIVAVGVAAFGDDPAVGRAFYGAGARGHPDVRPFLAVRGGDAVGIATGYRAEGGETVGVMGVGVVPEMRGEGLGSALTVHAARSYPGADLAWLHPSDEARSMYARLGFRSIAAWEIWTRRPPVR